MDEALRERLVEVGRQVHNCPKHGGAWCSCKVREFLDLVDAVLPDGLSGG